MKSVRGLLVALIFAVGLNSCFDAPVYPDTPEIEFKSLQFKPAPAGTLYDTIFLKINFKDGDGDLGLYADGSDDDLKTFPQYADHFYFVVGSKTKYVTNNPRLDTVKRIVRYKTKRTNPSYDTLPAYVPPFDCINWQLFSIPDSKDPTLTKVVDTVYFQINPNHNNIFVDFMVKQSNGTFTEFDFRKEYCSTYDGRFPVLSKDLSKKSPIEGELQYAIGGLGFGFVFSGKILKLRVTIQDRALHKSNTVETQEFQLK